MPPNKLQKNPNKTGRTVVGLNYDKTKKTKGPYHYLDRKNRIEKSRFATIYIVWDYERDIRCVTSDALLYLLLEKLEVTGQIAFSFFPNWIKILQGP